MVLERLKELRESNGLKQSDIAKILRVSPRSYSGYETGFRNIPYQALCKLADYYKTSTDYILERTDVDKPYPPTTRKSVEEL